MKTVNALKSAEIKVNDQTVETIEVKNPTQMWKVVKEAIAKHGHGVRILVTDENDNIFKDITVKELKNGKFYMVNAVKETSRGNLAKARKAATEKAAKIEVKKAKKRAYDKARRERIKAQKAATVETTEA